MRAWLAGLSFLVLPVVPAQTRLPPPVGPAHSVFQSYPARISHPARPALPGGAGYLTFGQPETHECLAPGSLARVDGGPVFSCSNCPAALTAPTLRLAYPDGRQWALPEVPSLDMPSAVAIPPVLPSNPFISTLPGFARLILVPGVIEISLARYVRLPDDLPLGVATLKVDGVAVQDIEIVPRAFGFLDGGRLVDGLPLRTTRPATPAGHITLEGTGLGRLPEYAPMAVVFNSAGAWRTARANGRRDPARPGVDLVEFDLPFGLTPSCGLRADFWVDETWAFRPVRLPVAEAFGIRCPEAAPFETADLDRVTAGERVPAVTLSVYTSEWQTERATSISARVHRVEVPRDPSALQPPGTCSLWTFDPFLNYDTDIVPLAFVELALPPQLVGVGFSIGGAGLDRSLDVRVRDAGGRVFYETTAGAARTPPSPAGPWNIATEVGNWNVAPLLVDRIDGPSNLLTLDRPYVVEWQTAGLQAGDRAEFTIHLWEGNDSDRYAACAADARHGAIRLPPSLIRELAAGWSGREVDSRLRFVRPREVRRQAGNERIRYVLVEQEAINDRSLLLP